jgi:hypothetical protein
MLIDFGQEERLSNSRVDGFGLTEKMTNRRLCKYQLGSTTMEFTMTDNLFARVSRAVQNIGRIRREREVSSRIQAVEAAVREASRECREVEERLRKLKPRN